MYESPIKVFQGNLEMQFESEILKAVQRADITVDRDELIRALRYDREQYQKGFDDARKDAAPVVRCKDCVHCGHCGKETNLEVMGFYGFCSRGKRRKEMEVKDG